MKKSTLAILVTGTLGMLLFAGCTPSNSAQIACEWKLESTSDEEACKMGVAVADEIAMDYAEKHSTFGIVITPSHSEAMRMRDEAVTRCRNGYAQVPQEEACIFGIDEYIEALATRERSSSRD